ncbi:hypothetical protein CBU02nite_27540 [Clostridium butyricum]|uniref:Uncharacterized protein n=1 Tax=Clostridium butyricum TaxID=1492 RepID=A0A512TQI7_CLOBU|nr:hypothetical protein [Clostridium butyricum]NOW21781.1 hypothetical protein [Clostridium butyricum]GEQ22248.1 hypothetical protein CBU02nite_27540 [Clostridium butyricum]
MEKEKFEIIQQNTLSMDELIDEKEKEIAQKILTDLEGTLVIRATSILKFCLKAIQYTKINKQTAPEVLVQEQLENLEIKIDSKKVSEIASSYVTNHDKA